MTARSVRVRVKELRVQNDPHATERGQTAVNSLCSRRGGVASTLGASGAMAPVHRGSCDHVIDLDAFSRMLQFTECCLQASSSLRWRFSPASAVESWSFVLEVGTGASSSWPDDVAAGLLLLQGYGACFRVCGRWLAGSEPTFPRRRRWLSVASLDPGAGGGRARPRSMDDRRWILQLRLISKPTCDGSSSAQGALGSSSSPVAAAGGEEDDLRRFAEDPGA